jgi:hypothetical protein
MVLHFQGLGRLRQCWRLLQYRLQSFSLWFSYVDCDLEWSGPLNQPCLWWLLTRSFSFGSPLYLYLKARRTFQQPSRALRQELQRFAPLNCILLKTLLEDSLRLSTQTHFHPHQENAYAGVFRQFLDHRVQCWICSQGSFLISQNQFGVEFQSIKLFALFLISFV